MNSASMDIAEELLKNIVMMMMMTTWDIVRSVDVGKPMAIRDNLTDLLFLH